MEKRIIDAYAVHKSVKGTARATGVSDPTVIKTLCNAGIYPTEQAETINRLAEELSVEEIASRLSIKPKAVCRYLPYTKGSYLTETKSINAQRIQKCRARKAKKAPASR